MAKAVSKTTATEKVRTKAVRKVTAYQDVFNSPTGKVVLAELMSRFHMMGPTYPPNKELSHYEMILNEGQRSVILYILAMMNVNIEQLRERIDQNAQILDNE